MMHIRDCAASQNVEASKPAYYAMQSTLTLAHVIGAGRLPERVQSDSRIEVPLYEWGTPQEESDAIIRVMARNAEEFTLTARSYRSMDRSFWVQLRRNLKAIIVHPTLKGALFFPETAEIFYSALIPVDRVVCLGPPGKAGTLLVQEGRRGYILPSQDGVMSVHIADPQG
jgi:hypothetical protein